MAISQTRKAACQAAIKDHLKHAGSREWSTVRDAFGDVSTASFWRWVRAAKAETLLHRVQALPLGAAQDAVIDETFAQDHRNLVNGLREPPRLRDLCAAAIDPQAVLEACLKNANEVVDHARASDGKIRSPKLMLAASKLMADVLRTAAAVSSVLLDERRVRDFYRAFMEEIKAESPELAARILARLEALNASYGLVSVIGR